MRVEREAEVAIPAFAIFRPMMRRTETSELKVADRSLCRHTKADCEWKHAGRQHGLLGEEPAPRGAPHSDPRC